MSKNYISVTVQKLKHTPHIGRSAAHDRRVRLDKKRLKKENIDSTRSHLNVCLRGDPSTSLTRAINSHIKANVPRTVRKDAVRCLELYLHVSPAWFDQGGDQKQLTKRLNGWLTKRFGDNYIEGHLHLDEKTPHIHAFITPITPDGRLHCRNFMTTKEGLADLQTEIAEQVKDLGLHRGEEGGGAMHEPPVAPAKVKIKPPEPSGLMPVVSKMKYDKLAGRFERLSEAYKLAANKAKLVTVKVDQADHLKNQNVVKTAQNKALKAELKQLRPIAAQVRGIEVEKVIADWQAATGKTPPLAIDKCRNAIDLVKLLERCDYKTAVQILATNYGVDQTTKSAKQQAIQEINTNMPKMIMSSKPRPKWTQMATKRAENKKIAELPAWKKLLKMGLLWPVQQVIDYPPPADNLDRLLEAHAAAEAVLAWALRRACEIASGAGVDVSKIDTADPNEIHKIAKKVLEKEGCTKERAEQFLPRKEQEKQIQVETDEAESQASSLKSTGTAEGAAQASQILKAVQQSPQTMTQNSEQKGAVPASKTPEPPTFK